MTFLNWFDRGNWLFCQREINPTHKIRVYFEGNFVQEFRRKKRKADNLSELNY